MPFSPSGCYVAEVMKSNVTTFSTSHNKGRNRTTSNDIVEHTKGAGTTFSKNKKDERLASEQMGNLN